MFNLSKIIDFARVSDDEYLSNMGLKKMSKDDSNFIIKYDKDLINSDNINTIGLFRSVVVQKKEDTYKVVAFAPPKSVNIKSDEIRSGLVDGKVIFQEFIEGTMINVYYDTIADGWELATRSIIGGKSRFFKQEDGSTFRQMFLEAMNEPGQELEFDDMDKAYSYSFVLQHPKNRIVLKSDKPKIYLCAIYKCVDNIVYEKDIYCLQEDMKCKVSVPIKYNYDTCDKAKTILANKLSTPFYCLGVVLKHENGIRSKMRNPNYEYVRHLRGNQPKLQFQYLNLRHGGKVKDYLRYYPEATDEFTKFRNQIHDFTSTLHNFYLGCFARKEMPLRDYPHEYKNHMYVLHQKYIKELIPIGGKVTRQVVIQYINEIEPARLMYCLNYKFREMKKMEASIGIKDISGESFIVNIKTDISDNV